MNYRFPGDLGSTNYCLHSPIHTRYSTKVASLHGREIAGTIQFFQEQCLKAEVFKKTLDVLQAVLEGN